VVVTSDGHLGAVITLHHSSVSGRYMGAFYCLPASSPCALSDCFDEIHFLWILLNYIAQCSLHWAASYKKIYISVLRSSELLFFRCVLKLAPFLCVGVSGALRHTDETVVLLTIASLDDKNRSRTC
jgi:hypothetical protein